LLYEKASFALNIDTPLRQTPICPNGVFVNDPVFS